MKLSTSLLIALVFLLTSCAATQRIAGDVLIDDTHVFPESMTSSDDGTLYIGSVKGNVYRAFPSENVARPWIRFSPENGILTILGVLADEAADTLWLCSVPNSFGPERSEGVSSVMAFNLQTGEQKGIYEFPAPASVCNDITVAKDGSVYVADTPNGRIFRLAPDATELELFGSDEILRGIDGLAFSEDATLYVNNVQTNKILRVDIEADGSMGEIVDLDVSLPLGGPDGFRLIEGNRFIQAEGTIGRLSVVTIDGDSANVDVLSDDLVSTPGATVVGNTAYVLESNIQYLFNPGLSDQEPPDFMIYAFPL